MAEQSLSAEDLTIENLTHHVIKLGSNIENERLLFVFGKLIQYSHDFVRDTKLTTTEWEAAWQYLTEVGIPKGRNILPSQGSSISRHAGRAILHAGSARDDPSLRCARDLCPGRRD